MWDDRNTREETEDCMQEIHKIIQLDAEVIDATNIHDFKSKLDNSKFGDETVGA